MAFKLATILVLIASAISTTCAFVPSSLNTRQYGGVTASTSSSTSSSTSLNMVFGPNQALAIERRKNPKAFESTINGLMRSKNLTREQAEKRYGEFLIDPDGFALKASAAERKEMGYKNWIEQAVAKSDDPDATRQRIDDFTAKNRIKGIGIMLAFSSVALYYTSQNPYIPPGNL